MGGKCVLCTLCGCDRCERQEAGGVPSRLMPSYGPIIISTSLYITLFLSLNNTLLCLHLNFRLDGCPLPPQTGTNYHFDLDNFYQIFTLSLNDMD